MFEGLQPLGKIGVVQQPVLMGNLYGLTVQTLYVVVMRAVVTLRIEFLCKSS
ncbi:MAG: hypothetical protein ACRC62_14825 [Microcoleus sp.]